MLKIDLLEKGDCDAITGEFPDCELCAFHAEQSADVLKTFGSFPYAPILEKKVNPKILEATPEGSLLLDIGAPDTLRTFDAGAVEKKNVRILSCGYAWPREEHREHAWLRTDLRRLPFAFGGQRPILDALQSFYRLKASESGERQVEALRSEVALLIGLLEERPIGSCVFGNVLRYLPEDIRERLLRLAAASVMPGGSVIFYDRPKVLEATFQKTQRDYGSRPEEVIRVLSEAGLVPQENALIAPMMATNTVLKAREKTSNLIDLEIKGMAWIRQHIANIRTYPPEKDDGKTLIIPGEEKTHLLVGGLRYISFSKPVSEG
jgi:hypothetical protein